jgi:subtilisin-like proprotein convertase family protein
MPRKLFSYFALPLLLLLSNSSGNSASSSAKTPEGASGTLEKMIVANGHVVMDLDLNRLNGIDAGSKDAKLETLQFQVGPNSFFTVLVFNDAFRGPDAGSMGLIPQNTAALPGRLQTSLNELVIEKLPSDASFDLAVRDGKTGFVFFNVEGNLYEFEAATRLLTIKDGRLLISEEFAKSLGQPAEAGSVAGRISIATTMYAIETSTLANGAPSTELPPLRRSGDSEVPNSVPGPDVIVGDLSGMQQFGSNATQVGVSIGTTSCNNGTVSLHWSAMPNTDHPVIPQNLYRLSGGATNDERFEQIGQSWLKHAFAAVNGDACGFGCGSGGGGLGPGCSDPYGASLNASQSGLGSRAFVNPFTGIFPSTARDHTGHNDQNAAPTHRALVEMTDLNPALNPGAIYYGEAQYVTPHEYAWCQANAGQCNMYNNVSYRRFNVSGTTSFTFNAVGSTVRMASAVQAWPGATIITIEPVPGIDGRAFIAYKVTNPSAGVWHYEYAIYNQNLDRSIQSFSVPLGCGITLTNVGFHAPQNHPGIANDGTLGSAGYSNAAWSSNQTVAALTWNSETLAQNENANAIRWGTLYNFRFDSDRGPMPVEATIGYYKTGTPTTVVIAGPNACNVTPSPIPSPTPIPTPTPTATVTPTPAATVTPTPGATPPPTPCGTITLSNPAPITIPATGTGSSSGAPANPYPSNIAVAIGGTVTKVTVKLNNLTHTFPDDIDVLLVGPGGQTCLLMSDNGGDADVTGVTLTFDDAAAASLPDGNTLVSGTFKPSNVGEADAFPAPAPAPGTNTLLSVFNGHTATGTWALYVVDDAAIDAGSIANGWELAITTNSVCGTPTPSPTATATATATATVPPMASPSPSGPANSPVPTPSTTPTPTPTPPSPTPTPPAPTPTPTSPPIPPAQATNLSTRMRVQPGDNVGIGGFIITGTAPKHVLLRAIGPSLAQSGVPDVLADPVLELHGPGAFATITSDNWRDDPVQEAAIIATGIPPSNNLESAIDATLNPGAYTAIVRGKNNTSGVALVEIYDLSPAVVGKLANISTRAFVSTGNNVVIAGFTLGGNTGGDKVIVRGLGPSLTAMGVTNVLADPMLELRDSNAALLMSADNWQENPAQAAELMAAGLAPANQLESGVVATLSPGLYTALLSGKNNGAGIGLVEVYDRGSP